MIYWKLLTILFYCFAGTLLASTGQLDLEVMEIREENHSYSDFCRRHPGECVTAGEGVISWSSKLGNDLERVNSEVKREIIFTLDPDLYGVEEFWNYPVDGRGDCEDNALEKRRRLVALGYPRAALRIATAFHRHQYYAHALLLVETSRGTWVMDQDNEEVLLWSETPYIFEARERPDGKWERFFQDW